MGSKIFNISLLAILFFSLNACYETEEGCLNSFANNYSIGADNACDTCCVFPTFSLNLSHSFDTLNFNTSSVYEDDFGQAYRVEELKYFISSIQLSNADGMLVSPKDSIEISSLKGNEMVVLKANENYALVNQLSPRFELGEMIANGAYNQIHFSMGLDPCFNHIDTASLEESHLLRVNKDSLYINKVEGFVFQRLRLIRDTSTMESILIEVSGDDEYEALMIPIAIQIDRGLDVSVSLKLDMKKWLQGIDVKNDQKNEILSKLKQNLGVAFSQN